jgi:CRP/FNR family transcriptional regulator, anaerobic regulatory protein
MRPASALCSHSAFSSASRTDQRSAALRSPQRCKDREALSRAIKLLCPRADAISVALDNAIFSEGDHAANFYFIKRGVVRLCMTTLQCGRNIADFMFANDPLGVIEQDSYTCTAEAATDVELLQISRAEVVHLLAGSRNMEALSSYAWQLAADAWRFQRTLEEQAPDRRLACFLIRVSQRTNTPIGRPMRLGISDRDLACHLGLTSEEVSGSLASLVRQRAIDNRNIGTYTILDATAIVELALQAALPNNAPIWHRTSPDLNSVLA